MKPARDQGVRRPTRFFPRRPYRNTIRIDGQALDATAAMSRWPGILWRFSATSPRSAQVCCHSRLTTRSAVLFPKRARAREFADVAACQRLEWQLSPTHLVKRFDSGSCGPVSPSTSAVVTGNCRNMRLRIRNFTNQITPKANVFAPTTTTVRAK